MCDAVYPPNKRLSFPYMESPTYGEQVSESESGNERCVSLLQAPPLPLPPLDIPQNHDNHKIERWNFSVDIVEMAAVMGAYPFGGWALSFWNHDYQFHDIDLMITTTELSRKLLDLLSVVVPRMGYEFSHDKFPLVVNSRRYSSRCKVIHAELKCKVS